MFTMDLVKYLEETHTVLITREALEELKDRANIKTARWVFNPRSIFAHLACSNCLSNAPYDCHTNYCPNCGAKMIEEEVKNE